jgi:hypothetical protein
MTDPIAFSGFAVFMALFVFGAYHLGFARGLALGFNRGFKCADNFRRLKRIEGRPRYENPRV